MKMKILKRTVWAANVLLLGVFVSLAVYLLGGAGEAGLSSSGAAPVDRPRPSGASRPLESGEYGNLLSSDSIVPVPPPRTPARRETPPTAAAVDISQLFGRKLIGTIVAQDSAYAVFEEPSGRQTGAFKGETVGKAKLLGIWKDQVLLEIDGRRGYVPLSTATSKPPPPPSEVASARDDAAAAMEAAIAEAGDEEEDDEPDDDETELDWDVITVPQYLEYLQNVGKYTSQVTILSHYDSNRNPDGLVLAKVPKSSEAYKRGLRARDIVKSIQDVPVTDLQAALKVAYQVLKDEDYLVDVLIVRNGVEETLSYEIWPE